MTAASPRRSRACLNHARLPARLSSEGRVVTLDRPDRGLWDTRAIAEGGRVASSAGETDRRQILVLVGRPRRPPDDPVRHAPVAVLGRGVAVGHVLCTAAGLRETERLREVLSEPHRWHAVRGHLHELDGDLPPPAYADCRPVGPQTSPSATLVRQAANARAGERRRNSRLTERPQARVPRYRKRRAGDKAGLLPEQTVDLLVGIRAST